MVRRCCCQEACRMVYFSTGGNAGYWINIKSTTSFEDGNTDNVAKGLWGMDHTNRTLYEVINQATPPLNRNLWRTNEKLLVPQPVGNPPMTDFIGVSPAIAPQLGQLFYSTPNVPGTTAFIRARSYTGVDSIVFTNTINIHGGGDKYSFPILAYCRSQNKIVFYRNLEWDIIADHFVEAYIGKMNVDGSGETIIYSFPPFVPTVSASSAFQLGIDNTHGKVLWAEHRFDLGFPETSVLYIKRCSLDGSGLETVLTFTPANSNGAKLRCRGIQYSHKEDRIYMMLQDAFTPSNLDTVGGLYSCAFNGTGLRLEVKVTARSTVDNQQTIADNGSNRIWLGCGIETLGSATKA